MSIFISVEPPLCKSLQCRNWKMFTDYEQIFFIKLCQRWTRSAIMYVLSVRDHTCMTSAKSYGLSQSSSPYRTFCYLYNISVRISGEPLPLPRWTSYMNGRYLLLIRINKAFCFIFGIRWFSQDRSALMNSAWNTHTIYFSNGNQKVGSCSMTRLFGDKPGNSFKRHISRYNITRLGICKWRHRCAMDHIYS